MTEKSNRLGRMIDMMTKIKTAFMTDFYTITYSLTSKICLVSTEQIKLYDGEREVAITSVDAIGKTTSHGNVIVKEALSIGKPYVLAIENCGRKIVVPTKVFDTPYFRENYLYDGDDLGAVIDGKDTVFRLWAPTAFRVVLKLYSKGDGGRAFATVDMVRGAHGVWIHRQRGCGHGVYYVYRVTNEMGTQTAVDPYAKAAGVNGERGMVVDLSKTNPKGWEKPYRIGTNSYTDAVIWEIHVRDFSNRIETSKYKGKYLAFTERGLVNSHGVSVGVDYLMKLGVTHVHLLPIYDYATVDETNTLPAFNWGYDPKNYNVPDGSYSTDPYHGEVRISEVKQMVQALHKAGIGVIMDVVYNHTYDKNSLFQKIVPYYYYRYTDACLNSSASGCGNDTASERAMFRKFMVDSVSYWAKEYKLDGFRFDLMGLHDLETMSLIEKAVHTINPRALLYGEGWQMGATMDGSLQATQGNISRIVPSNGAAGGISVFNDVIRDGLKGSVFEKSAAGYISGAFAENAEKIRFGISGGKRDGVWWRVENADVINYMSAHDNHTLWDKLMLSAPDASHEERLQMNRLGAAILMIARGTPFMQAGEEMLRTKHFDENSYRSGDEINNLDWESLIPGGDAYAMMSYYKALIAMRKKSGVFSQRDVQISFADMDGGMEITFEPKSGKRALVLLNPTEKKLRYALRGKWRLLATGKAVFTCGRRAAEEGNVTIPSRSLRIYMSI